MINKIFSKFISISTLFLFPILFVAGCFDKPNDFVAPSYNIKLAIPISDSTYTIDDFLSNDSTITASTDPNVLGLLFFRQKNDITTFTVGDSLKIDNFSSVTSKSIGSLKIDSVTAINTRIKISDWSPFTGGQTAVVLALSPTSSTHSFTNFDQFESAIFVNGTLTLSFSSNLPIETNINSLIITNIADGSVILQSSSNINIPANGSNQVSFPLNGLTIKNSVQINVTMSSPGSNGIAVTFPQNAGTDITTQLTSFSLSSATAVFPAQDPFIVNDVVIIDDSTKVEIVVFDEGIFNVEFSNNLDLPININFKVENLKKPDGSIYSQNLNLLRKEQKHKITIPSLKNWSIVTATPGTPTNKMNYTATVTVPATSNARTLNKNDNVTAQVNVSNLKIKNVIGQIKLTNFNIDKTSFELDLGELKNKFRFDSINVKDPQIFLHLKSSVGLALSFNGIITGTSNTEQKTMQITDEIAADADQVFDLRNFGLKDFINSFHTTFPTNFSFSGTGIVNPHYTIGDVSKDDTVSGFLDIQLPLDVGIAGGSFIDTTKFDSIKISNKDINSIRSVEITVEIQNKIPARLSATATVLDKNDQPLFTIPPSYNSISEILVNPANVDNNGFATSAVSTVQIIKLNGEDARNLIRNRKIVINLKLLTPPENSNVPVKFRNTDQIKIKLYGTTDFKINNN